VFSFYKIFDLMASSVFFWIPFYYPLKFIVLVWLIYPETRGATVIYDNYLKSYMEKYSASIEHMSQGLAGKLDQASSNIEAKGIA